MLRPGALAIVAFLLVPMTKPLGWMATSSASSPRPTTRSGVSAKGAAVGAIRTESGDGDVSDVPGDAIVPVAPGEGAASSEEHPPAASRREPRTTTPKATLTRIPLKVARL